MQNPWAVSQVFLEEGEIQTVETLIKCIVIASGNDASVAMAEYIGGDEATFVKMMNRGPKAWEWRTPILKTAAD